MGNETYYNKVKTLTEQALEHIEYELDGSYKGHTGANAVSMYLNDTHDINVTCDNEADRAFKDALSK